jgi:superoxide dismutase, Fe-Mn family
MSTAPARAVHSLHFDLPPLPYAPDALAPVISRETLELHHGKHHRKYVDTMNQLLGEQHLQAQSLEEVVRRSSGKLFNNAAQAWNHAFYWQSLSPRRSKPSQIVMKRIESDFGGWERFAQAFADAANGQFGSGWAWLVKKDARLEIVATANAETPMARGTACLLASDVLEHAYYVDYRNEREKYVAAVINELLNWEFAEKNLGARA